MYTQGLSEYGDPKYLGQWVLFFCHLSDGEALVQTWGKKSSIRVWDVKPDDLHLQSGFTVLGN